MTSSAIGEPVSDRAHAVAVHVADLVQGESLALVEADAEPPFLPAHLPAVELEARAFGLDDLERPQVVPVAAAVRLSVVPRARVGAG